jgi:hypothetical protein
VEFFKRAIFLNLIEEQRLRDPEDNLLKKIFGCERENLAEKRGC